VFAMATTAGRTRRDAEAPLGTGHGGQRVARNSSGDRGQHRGSRMPVAMVITRIPNDASHGRWHARLTTPPLTG